MSAAACIHCGQVIAENVPEEGLCPSCGQPWAAPPDPGAPPAAEDAAAASPGWFRWINYALVGLLVFLAALIGVIYLARQMRPLVHGEAAADDQVARLIARMEQSSAAKDRQAAARQLLALGPEALADALDRTTEVSPDRNQLAISGPVIEALAGLQGDIAPPAAQLLGSPREDVRVAAATILKNIGAQARGAVEPLAGALADENRWVRWAAAEALAQQGAAAAPASDALLAATEHPDRHTRRYAVEALGAIGPAAQQAAPRLADLQDHDPERSVRLAAKAAYHQVNLDALVAEAQAGASEELRALMEQLGRDDEFAARTAAAALGKLGWEGHDAMPALAKALGHPSKWVRLEAAQVLGGFGREARHYAPALRRLASDPDPEVRQAAATALARVEK